MKSIQATKRLLNNFIHLFFPKLCVTCKEPLIEGEEQICLHCLCDLPQTGYPLDDDNPVFQLFIGKADVVRAAAWLHYEKGGKVQRLIHSLKYYGNRDLAYRMGRQMACRFQADIAMDMDVLVPVPLHRTKQRKRGYNQSEWICRGISSVTGIPVCTNLVRRVRATDTQTNKTIYDRWTNVSHVFTLADDPKQHGKRILLVDDVVTSGSTLASCAEALLAIPDAEVSILALAAP